MRPLVTIATVLLVCQAAKVPQDQRVIVPVTSSILVPTKEKFTISLEEETTVKYTGTDADKLKHYNSDEQPIVMRMIKANHSMLPTKASNLSMRSVKVDSTTATTGIVQTPLLFENSSPTTSFTMDPCDLLCTKFEFDPICATNGLCLHEFPNQCILETYNCRHSSATFSAIRDDRCQMGWLTKCDESEMI